MDRLRSEKTMLRATDFTRALANGKLKIIDGTKIFVAAKHKHDLDASEYAIINDDVSINFPTCTDWVRLGSVVDSKFRDTNSKKIKIKIEIDCIKNQETMTNVSIQYLSKNGAFKIAKKLGNKIVFSNRRRLFQTNTFIGFDFEDQMETDVDKFYVVVEFHEAFHLQSFSIEFEEIKSPDYNIPYLNFVNDHSTRLIESNLSISSDVHINRNLYLLNQSELSVRLDCIETAYALYSHIDRSKFTHAEDIVKWLWVSVEVLLARGEIDRLKNILLDHHIFVLKNDGLFTALSICFPADPLNTQHFERLPSGKLNRNYLSRMNDGQFAIKSLREGHYESFDIADAMLLASNIRFHSYNFYQKIWKSFLTYYGMSSLSIDNIPTEENMLKKFTFERPVTEEVGPKISVIMSAYNSESTIDYAIRSIINQSYTNWELLICDDCSNDRTKLLLESYKHHPNIKIFCSNNNQGPYNIRNELLSKASGDFVTFQDADDLAHPQRLAMQLAGMIKGKLFSIGKWVRVRPDGEIVFFRDHQCLRMCVVSFMFPKSLVNQSRIYRHVLCGGDTEFYEKIRYENGNNAIANIDAPLIFGLWSERSLTRSNGIEATEDGYKSTARRIYSEGAARQRLLGAALVTDESIDEVNKSHKIYRKPYGVSQL